MVKMKSVIILWFCFLTPCGLFAQDVVITTEVTGDAIVDTPLKGSITITHDRSKKVDLESFLLGENSLKVEFIKDVPMAPDSPLVVSIYEFMLEPQKPGLHVLPEVSAKVGGKMYRSFPATYEVREKVTRQQDAKGQPLIVLELETILRGTTPIFPGQRLTVGYTFIFTYSIELSKEILPLLDAEGFRKIGGKESSEYSKDGLNYVEITQQIEALTPGDFSFAPGIVQGRAYRPGPLGQREYSRNESYSESQPVTISVLPFPGKEKPPSFNGAIGEALEFDVSLLTPDTMMVGDKMILLIKISGYDGLGALPMPEVCCQPGYSGFFRLSDLPPVEEVSGSVKTFEVELRPLNTSIKAVPSLEFSYFNPKIKSYETLRSEPIPIVVNPLTDGKIKEPQYRIGEVKESVEEDQIPQPGAIEIEGNYLLTASDMKDLFLGTWWGLLIIPIGVGAVIFQIRFRHYVIQQRQIKKPKRSQEIFAEALKQPHGSARFFRLLQEAFLLRLVERGDISSVNTSPDYLPDTGAPGRVRELFREIEEKRFSRKELEIDQVLLSRARKLFQELKRRK